MWYLALTTLAGSMLFGGYLCWEKICASILTQRMRYRALIIVLLVYVIPWVWMKRVYGSLGEAVFGRGLMPGRSISVNMADINALAGDYKTLQYRYMLWITGGWLFIALLLMCMKCLSYALERRHTITLFPEKRDLELSEMDGIAYGECRYRRKVEIHETVGEPAAFTIGYIKPVIFVPKGYGDEAVKMILRHEMVHVGRRDLLVKLLMELVCCLHWFNPVVYVLDRHLDEVCELACDECVVEEYGIEERALYAKIVTESMRASNRKTRLRNGFADGKSKVRERMERIMDMKDIKTWKKLISAGLFTILLAANSMTALAYPGVYQVQDDVTVEEFADMEEGTWSYDVTDCAVESLCAEPMEIILYDEQFMDESGQIYQVDSCAPQAICFSHDKNPGTFTSHAKDGNGGCIVRVYRGQMCHKCNTIWLEELVSTTLYTKCSH